MTLDYVTVARTVEQLAVEDAERDLLCTALMFPEYLLQLPSLGITPESLRDARHVAFLALMLDILAARRWAHGHGGEIERFEISELVSGIARLRRHGADDEHLASAADLDGAFLLSLWTYVPDRVWDDTVAFLRSAQRERLRDLTVEACIAALAHGSNPTAVFERLAAALSDDADLDPEESIFILTIPPAQEHP